MAMKVADDDDYVLDTSLENVPIKAQVYGDKPYDETEEVYGDEDVQSCRFVPTPVPNGNFPEIQTEYKSQHLQQLPQMKHDETDDDSEEFGEDLINSSEESDGDSKRQPRGYQAGDYEMIGVSSEVRDLFNEIKRFIPRDFELDQYLKPFIPDYMPAVGDIDPMLKVPRADGKRDLFGIVVLDEPALTQSDPAVMKLAIRMNSKQSCKIKEEVVKSILHDDKAIEHWIENIGALHRTQPPPTVHYTRNMPSIDMLMQEWPSEFESLLKEIGLPSTALDCDLLGFVDIICALLDIPVYKSRVQSLHVLFTLYTEFKNSQVETGKSRKRNYTCYPGPTFSYGLPYPPRTDTTALALQGWPGSCRPGTKPRSKHTSDRDFTALNRGFIDLGLASNAESHAYRSVYDVQKKEAPDKVKSVRRAPLVFPPGFVFGQPPRVPSPIADVLEHKYQKCWIQQQILDRASAHHFKKTQLPPPGAYRENRTSELRRYKEPVDPAPLWHMPRFSRYAKPHLDTFALDGPKAKEDALYANVSESVPRQAQFSVHRSGIYQPAVNNQPVVN